MSTIEGGGTGHIPQEYGTVDLSGVPKEKTSIAARNQDAISAAKRGDFTEIRSALSLLVDPPPSGSPPKGASFFTGNYITALFSHTLTVLQLAKENKEKEADLAVQQVKRFLHSIETHKKLIENFAKEKRGVLFAQLGTSIASLACTLVTLGVQVKMGADVKKKIDREFAAPGEKAPDVEGSVKKVNPDIPETKTPDTLDTDVELPPGETQVEIQKGRGEETLESSETAEELGTDEDYLTNAREDTAELDDVAAQNRETALEEEVEVSVEKQETEEVDTETTDQLKKEEADREKEKLQAYRQEMSMLSDKLQIFREIVGKAEQIANKVADIFGLEADTKKQIGEITQNSVQKMAEKGWTEAEKSASTWDEMATSWVRLFEGTLQKHSSSWDRG